MAPLVVPHRLVLGLVVGAVGPGGPGQNFIRRHLSALLKQLWTAIVQQLQAIAFSDVVFRLFEQPSEWPSELILWVWRLLNACPHIFHIVGFSIFFGPIIALIPLLMLHELVLSCFVNISMVDHGISGRGPESRYHYLHTHLEDWRESLWSQIDRSSSSYNKLTTDYWAFFVLRLFCFGLACLAVFIIWEPVW